MVEAIAIQASTWSPQPQQSAAHAAYIQQQEAPAVGLWVYGRQHVSVSQLIKECLCWVWFHAGCWCLVASQEQVWRPAVQDLNTVTQRRGPLSVSRLKVSRAQLCTGA
jgi:hypothetical protein